MKTTLVLILSSSIFAVGCAHQLGVGAVVEKQSAQDARVQLRGEDAKPGDRVRTFQTVCPVSPRGAYQGCYKQILGEGTVVRTLDDRYAEVRFDAGSKFEAGSYLEKK